jgi:hypothetical protein
MMMTLMTLLSLSTSHGFSFLPSSISSGMRTTQQRNNNNNNNNIGTCSSNSALEMAKKKGFGNTPPPPPQKSKKRKPPPQPQTTSLTVPAPDTEQMITSSDDMNFNEFAATEPPPSQQSQQMGGDTSRGKIALEKMRRVKAEERNAELQKIKNVQDVDQLVRETGGEAAVIPEKVAQRMGKRMLPFVGIPLFGGIGAFIGFWYMVR